MSGMVLVSATSAGGDGRPAAAALAVAGALRGDADGESCALLVDLGTGSAPRGALLASGAARAGAVALAEAGFDAAPRGHVAFAAAGAEEPSAALAAAVEVAVRLGGLLVVRAPADLFVALRDGGVVPPGGCLLQAAGSDPRALLALIADEHRSRGLALRIWRHRPGALPARRALAGLRPGGGLESASRRALDALARGAARPRMREAVPAPGLASSVSGQALPLALGIGLLALALAVALVAIGGGAAAKGRAQRAVDLAALSAARSMADDFPRLFRPRRPAAERPLPRAEYKRRARVRALVAARRNGLPRAALKVRFPDRASFAPLRVEVRARLRVGVGDADPQTGAMTRLRAVAAVEPPAIPAGAPGAVRGSGGGYSGPLAMRQGKPMRPDVASAFDRLARAAARDGHGLTITSAYRSDAEQARLFAANPDPRWVAPPGTSLHRCGTELDLGPPSAYGWLAANAARHGFFKRYPHEPWHFGYVRGPAPCSSAARQRRATARAGDGRSAGSGLPSFVPVAYRRPLLRSASRNGVPAALLAAQLMAESNFNPSAVSPAGARGIAQFMPATAAAYGLRDPFDPRRSIAAQGRMMGELMRRFGSTELALAAYNAGPGAVAACGCIPPYAETRAYVARILGLLDGAGELPQPQPALLVRLVR